MKIEAIVPAAGLGLRLKSKTAKPLLNLNGRPILFYSLEALSKNKSIKRIIIAIREEHRDSIRSALDTFGIRKKIDLAVGGDSRLKSVENCLKQIAPDTDYILIHDAARPFLSEGLLSRCIKEAKRNRAVICAVPVKATIKQISRPTEVRRANQIVVRKTLDRDELWEIQTPQVFKKDLLLEAYGRFRNTPATDDASLVEKLGVKVKVISGAYFNIKITTPEDLVFAKALLATWMNKDFGSSDV
jgi:2-C-methyl-D-erythritol 4-phosphate cytidylyltransferase